MFIILTYDVEAKRNPSVLKECRRYLIHVQKSVFEGHVSDSQLKRIKANLQKIIDPEKDQIAIYKFVRAGGIEKEIIGYHIITTNII